jgi:hypothetical protein
MADLHALDQIKADLEKAFPGWHVWYVPGVGRDPTWCAQPRPLINATSPEHLAAEITQAHTEAAGDWPALARIDDYRTNAPGIPEAQ